MAASEEQGPEGGMLAAMMHVNGREASGFDAIDSNPSWSPGLRLDKSSALIHGGRSTVDSASPLQEVAGSWEEGPDSAPTSMFPPSRGSDSIDCSLSSEDASRGVSGGLQGLERTPQVSLACSLGHGPQAQAQILEGDADGTFALEGTDSETWWTAAIANATGQGELDVSDIGPMLEELGWSPEGGTPVPLASAHPQCNSPVPAAASRPQELLQQLQGAVAAGRKEAVLLDHEGDSGIQWRVDISSEGVEPLGSGDVTPQLAGQLGRQLAGEGMVRYSASSPQHEYELKQVYATGMPAQAAATSLLGSRGQSIPGTAPGMPLVGKPFPPYAAAQSMRDASAPEPAAKRKRGRKKAQPEPQEPKVQPVPEKLGANAEPLVPKASLESKPADLAARLAMLVRKPDHADMSKREVEEGCTTRTPGPGGAGLLLEELDEVGEPGDEDVFAEGDSGYTNATRAGMGASAPGAPPASRPTGVLSRDPTEWSMPSAETWGLGDDGAPRAFGASGMDRQNWQELLAALGPGREPRGHSLELAGLTPLENPGGFSWLTSGVPGAQGLGGSGDALALGPTRGMGLKRGREAAYPWNPQPPFQVSHASIAMGIWARRSGGSARGWSLPKGMMEAMSPLDFSLRERVLCLAEAVAEGDRRVETDLIPALRQDACPRGSPAQRTVHYFVDALAKRLRGEVPQTAGHTTMPTPEVMRTTVGLDLMRFMEKMPYRAFWLQASTSYALEAAAGHARVHIVDIGPWIGTWRVFFHELAAAKGRTRRTPHGLGGRDGSDAWAFPPDWELSKVFRNMARQTEGSVEGGGCFWDAWKQPLLVRFTVVMIPDGSPRGSGPAVTLPALEEELTLLAAQAGVGLEFSVVNLATGLGDFSPANVECRPGEVLIVQTNTHLEALLDDSVLRSNPRNNFLKSLKALEPAAILVSNMESELNLPFFLNRFNNAFSICLAMLLSFDISSPRSSEVRMAFEGGVIAKIIENVVACEGSFVHMRAETLRTMRSRMASLGFQPVPLSPSGLQQLKDMLLAYPSSYDVRLRKGCAQLSWAGIPMVGASAWKPIIVYSSDSE